MAIQFFNFLKVNKMDYTDSNLNAVVKIIAAAAVDKKKDEYFISALDELEKGYAIRDGKNDKILADFFALLKKRLKTGKY
jgi:GTP-binding protein EngB required for normal cell division